MESDVKASQQATLAASDIIDRAGVGGTWEMGYLDDEVENPRWWMSVTSGGEKLIVDDYASLLDCAEQFVRVVLTTGAPCPKCNRMMAVSTTADPIERSLDRCVWWRIQDHWQSACYR